MGIDDARQRDHAGSVDRLGVRGLERRPDGTDRAILDQDVGREKSPRAGSMVTVSAPRMTILFGITGLYGSMSGFETTS